jgi:hypothetical protein
MDQWLYVGDGVNAETQEKYMIYKMNPDIKKWNLARDLVVNNCEEYHFIANYQFTVPQNNNGAYDSILTNQGKELYQSILEKVERQEFKDHITNYCFQYENSGSWFNDAINSPFYDKKRCHELNTFNNKVVEGIMRSKKDELELSGEVFKTTPIIFHTDTWCWTRSGSLYSLSDKKI